MFNFLLNITETEWNEIMDSQIKGTFWDVKCMENIWFLSVVEI